MLYTHFSNFKVVGYLISYSKFTNTFAVFCRFNVLVRHEVIRYKSNLILVKYTIDHHLIHFLNGNWTGDIITKNKIQVCFDQLSGSN